MVRVLIKADSRFPVNRKKIRQLIKSMLRESGVEGEIEIGVCVVGDRKMKTLNQRYLKRDETAIILTFPLENTGESSGLGFVDFPDDVLRLGDIVISYPQVLKKAAEENVLVDNIIEDLVKYGLRCLLEVE